jgi:hypothetical protein
MIEAMSASSPAGRQRRFFWVRPDAAPAAAEAPLSGKKPSETQPDHRGGAVRTQGRVPPSQIRSSPIAVSMAIEFSPLAATNFPTGGHLFSPLVATNLPTNRLTDLRCVR